MSEITFLCPPELERRIPAPVPASKCLPDWFHALPRDMGMPDAHGLPAMTVRACLPVVDIMSLGWIIPLPFDVYVGMDPDFGLPKFSWAEDVPFDAVERHHPAQIGADRPPFMGLRPLKFINPWRILLPPGWSASFLHPVNHFELPFVAFNGAVDCDALDVPVNIPFFWTGDPSITMLPAGTPMVQVVPYQRAALPKGNVRAETQAEAATRAAALTRKYSEESVYSRQWRRRHERNEQPK